MINLLADMWPIITTMGKRQRESNEAFENGKEFGFELGITEALKQKFEVSEEVSPSMEREINDFLIERNLCACYDLFRGGFRIRQYMGNKEHAEEMAERRTMDYIKENSKRK